MAWPPRTGSPGDWWLGQQRVQGLEVAPYVIDLEAQLAPGGKPAVVRLLRIERQDGQPLGSDPLTLDLDLIAVDAVLAASANVMVWNEDHQGWTNPTDTHDWSLALRMIRGHVATYRGRVTWTTERDNALAQAWRHVVDHGCGTSVDLADALGLKPATVQSRIKHLRGLRGTTEVPKGKPGRRWSTTTDNDSKD